MRIIKRDGSEVAFKAEKIANAIRGANKDVSESERMPDVDIENLTNDISDALHELGHTPHVEEIQDMVEEALCKGGFVRLGLEYAKYRLTRSLARKANTTDEQILTILDCTNEEMKQENSNKNPTINSVQRDYMAGEVSRDLTRRILLPPEVTRAHEEGLIHFHDEDYYAQRMHNCYHVETKFLTPMGIVDFTGFKDGDTVTVLGKDNEWHDATVHYYGEKKMQKVTLVSSESYTYSVVCTPDHRWYLGDETVTTNLVPGDILFTLPGKQTWQVNAIEPLGTYPAWCVEEPATHSFVLDHDIVTGNCDLVNLNDMLQNGTVISGTYITKPHSFSTAANIATQIIAQVASNQYGGQSITLSHLAPFVDVSRQRIREEVIAEGTENGLDYDEKTITDITERRVRQEITRGVQTIQYQLITLMTTNGQAPFLSVFMYLDEVPEGRTRDDLAMIIEEVLRQRYKGVQNEAGAWITPAFPKLLYVLDEDNTYEGSKYFYLTQLAAKCTAKRLVPDYISAKVMRELKLSKGEEPGEGDVYPCMGCVPEDEVVSYRYRGTTYTEGIGRMWERLSVVNPVHDQATLTDPDSTDVTGNLYIDLTDVEVWDADAHTWVKCSRIIRNGAQAISRLYFSDGRAIDCTDDHIFTTTDGTDKRADELTHHDLVPAIFDATYASPADDVTGLPVTQGHAYLLGLVCTCGNYRNEPVINLSTKERSDVAKAAAQTFNKCFGESMGATTTVVPQSDTTKVTCAPTNEAAKTNLRHVTQWFQTTLDGTTITRRHLPAHFLEWTPTARTALLAGIVDGLGVATRAGDVAVTISGNKELALQTLLLVQSLGMVAHMEIFHERKRGYGTLTTAEIKFRVTTHLLEALHSKRLYEDLVCEDEQDTHTNPVGARFLHREEIKNPVSTFDLTTETAHFAISAIQSHNCRSFLTPDRSGNGYRNAAKALDWKPEPKYYGRFNQGVVTLNLPYVALLSEGDEARFWEILDGALELCHTALRCRHERLKGTLSDAAPILWQHGALARLNPGETIDQLLVGGYSTISLGYAGLYECVRYMTGHSHTDPDVGRPFGLAVMQALNDACTRWKVAENIDYSVYGTPIESTTYKFAKALQRRFGIIPGITDHGYITNSYHVNVRENIDAFTKLSFEAPFQQLSPGGAISYVEVPDMQDNLEAVIAVIQHIYEHIMYAELNTKSDYCQACGYDGEIKIVEDDGKLVWECPNCGCRDQDQLNVARRTCGYIGTQFWNQGRTQEIKERVLHL